MGRQFELLEPDPPLRKADGHFEFAAHGLHDLPQRRNQHVGLGLEFREARLLHSNLASHLVLGLAERLADLAHDHFGDQFAGAPLGDLPGLGIARPVYEFLE